MTKKMYQVTSTFFPVGNGVFNSEGELIKSELPDETTQAAFVVTINADDTPVADELEDDGALPDEDDSGHSVD